MVGRRRFIAQHLARYAGTLLSAALLTACGGGSDTTGGTASVAARSVEKSAAQTDMGRKMDCSIPDETLPVGAANVAPAVVPGIRTWHGSRGTWSLSPTSRIVVEQADAGSLWRVGTRLRADLLEVTGLDLPIVVGPYVHPGDIGLSLKPCPGTTQQIGDEGYTLSASNSIILRANHERGARGKDNGLFYATRTLLQMLMLDGRPAGAHRTVPQGYAIDAPLYPERTFMVDVGRKFADKGFLEAYMKFMAWYKINTLHLVISGDLLDRTPNTQTGIKAAFRLYSHNPNFTQQPLSYDGLYYSKNDWNELEDVAEAYGITIVPEFDTPGHSQAMARAFDPSSTSEGLDTTNPATLRYVERVWDEFLPWFRSQKVHIGGDEAGDTASIQTFQNNLARYLQSRGKTVEMWQDTVSGQSNYDPNLVIQNWSTNGPLPWTTPKFKWINSSGSFYVTPNAGGYEESSGFLGDSFYGTDAGLPFTHPTSDGEVFDWFGNTAFIGATSTYQPAGGQIALWSDMTYHNPYTYEDLAHYVVKDVIPAAGQIWWNGQRRDPAGAVIPYATLRTSVAVLQYGPGVKSVAMFSGSPLSATAPAFSDPPAYVVTPDYPAQAGVLSGLAVPYNCRSCGGGEVGYLGHYGTGDGTLTMTIPVPSAGTYLLPIYYVMGTTVPETALLTINGAAPVTVTFPLTGGGSGGTSSTNNLSGTDQEVIVGTFVTLQAGINTIKFSNPTTGMPNIGGLGTPLLQPSR